MAVHRNGRAPYASTGSIKTVIEKHRQVGLQTMSVQRLQQIGVTEALAPRTMYALTFLGFYNEDGDVTPEFDALRKVPEHDFKPRLASLLREAYAPILEVLDPATATQLDVENAFRGFEPTGQLPRMVQLFIGLMVYAEVMPEDQRRKSPAPGTRAGASRAAGGNAGGRKKDAGASDNSGRAVHETAPVTPQLPTGTQEHSTRADLGEAGYVTLLVQVNPLKLSKDDRSFLFDLVDKFEARQPADLKTPAR